MYLPHVAQLHIAEHRHNVFIVGVSVHFYRGVAQGELVAFEPCFCLCAHQGMVVHLQTGFVLR